MHASGVYLCVIVIFVFRASYDTSAPSAKRKCLEEGETDDDKVEEYKASREWDTMIKKRSWAATVMAVSVLYAVIECQGGVPGLLLIPASC